MLEGIKFLFLAFLTVFVAVKLAIYADAMEKKTKLGGLLIGGLLLASVTSFPELVTCMSAIFINNPNLAIGDILGSNVFNLLIISVLDIVFIKMYLMNKLTKGYIWLILLLILMHILVILGFNNIFIFNISIISGFIFVLYVVFIIFLSNIKIVENKIKNENNINYLLFKFLAASIMIIILGVLITIQANKIVSMNGFISSSTVGAFLLGITTSLPEVVSVYALVRIGSYNLAFSNIVGSNAFNFFIFTLSDLFISGRNLYSFRDNDSFIFVIFGMIMHLIILFSILRKKPKVISIYILPSFLIILLYAYIFYLQFLLVYGKL